MDMSWMTMEVEDDHTQWPYYLPIQNPNEVSNSSHHHHHLLSPLNLLGENDLKLDHNDDDDEDEPEEELGAMKEMMFRIAAMQPVDIDPATIRKPRRRNVRISDDPQSVAARHRRERISEKIRILQRLVPGGTKMDTASMLEEAIRYVKFLKRQIKVLQSHHQQPPFLGIPATAAPPASAPYLFGGDGGAAGDDPMCFSHKFVHDQ